MGLFYPFLKDRSVRMIGVEAAGHGIETGKHAASLTGGQVGILHGNKTYLLQSEAGQVRIAHSISAGLDYPAVGPEHSWLRDSGRVAYEAVRDDEAVAALRTLAEHEGIIPALESSHAVASAIRLAPTLSRRTVVIVNLSGRGDKDMETVAAYLGDQAAASPNGNTA
jgi:tryptophan synthase beta chain